MQISITGSGDSQTVEFSGVMDLIAGQSGVDGNSGAVSAKTQRVVLATDVALPTGTNVLGKLSDITTSITPGTSAAHLGKAIDSVVGATDTGIAMLVKRKDALATITPADGDYTTPQVDAQGAVWVRNSVTQSPSYSKARISSATTTTPKSGPGVFHGIIINKAVAAGTITIYDNTAASGTVIGVITFGAALLSDPPIDALFDAQISTGITIVTSAAFDITVLYN